MAVSDFTPIGSRFSRLTVIGTPVKNKHYISLVSCRCDCGNETVVSCRQLLNNQTKSCGCARADAQKARAEKWTQEGKIVPVISGARFGKLVVVSDKPVGSGSRRKIRCLCDCGTECLVVVGSLRSSRGTRSCGCLVGETQREMHPIPVGERFGRLVIARDVERRTGNHRLVEAKCDCGKVAIVSINNLRSGHTSSCGCAKSDIGEKLATHGHTRKGAFNRTYSIYRDMRTRCENPKYREFHLYGGRGITVCERWQQGYEFFLADMGERPPGMSLERERVNEGYSPDNCKWATDEEQANNKRNNVVIEHNGKRMTIAQWARELNVKASMLYHRASQGWPPERILSV
jgi:hypothetical protein